MTTADDLRFVLEIIHFAGEDVGRKKLQKITCILKHKHEIQLGFAFKQYFYGPDSVELDSSIKSLVGAGYLQENSTETKIGWYSYNYTLTDEGKREIQPIIDEQLPIYNVKPEQIRRMVNEISMMESEELTHLSKTIELKN